MSLTNLQELYVEELKDLYSAEHQIMKALPKMAKAASSERLREAFNHHLDETQGQIERLDQIFQDLGKSPRGKKCMGMEGLIEEGSEILKEKGAASSVKDAGLISAAQRVEHYEIAAYGTVQSYAHMLGYEEQAQALQETLNEEGETDHKLTEIAESNINLKAQSGERQANDESEQMGAMREHSQHSRM